MPKKLGDYEKGGGKIIAAGDFKFVATDFKIVVGGSGALYVVVDLCVVTTGSQRGKHTEIGFSLSENSQSFARAWMLALGLTEETYIPDDDKDAMTELLQSKCRGAIVQASITAEKDSGGYLHNQVDPPWGIEAAVLEEGETIPVEETQNKGEYPPW